MREKLSRAKGIAAALVSGTDDRAILCRVFGHNGYEVQDVILRESRKAFSESDGQFWKFFELQNGAVFSSIDTGRKVTVKSSGGGSTRRMGSEAAGLVLWINVLDWLVIGDCGSHDLHAALTANLEKLRCYAKGHPEAKQILSLLD